MNLFSIVRNWTLYKQWRRRKKGLDVCDYTKGCGYYITVGLLGHNPIGRESIWDMSSGKRMRVKLLDYKIFRDPNDMIEESYWQYIGYVGEKALSDMSWEEYLKEK